MLVEIAFLIGRDLVLMFTGASIESDHENVSGYLLKIRTEIGSLRMTNFDDMTIELRNRPEMWKKLLSSQYVNVRDAYTNLNHPGNIPVIVTTNNESLFKSMIKSKTYAKECYFMHIPDFMGPPDKKPLDLTEDSDPASNNNFERNMNLCVPNLDEYNGTNKSKKKRT